MRRVLGAATLSIVLTLAMVPVSYLWAHNGGRPLRQFREWSAERPPTVISVEAALEFAAVMFVLFLLAWPKGWPLPFENVQRPWEHPPDERPPN